MSTVRQTLQAVGDLSVFTATDSQMALRLLSEIRPDLILMDVRMFCIEGVGLPIKARQSSSAPIFFLNPPGEMRPYGQDHAGGNGVVSRVRSALADVGIRLTSFNMML